MNNNYTNFIKHLEKTYSQIYFEPKSPHHLQATQDIVNKFCMDLDFQSVVDFGCGEGMMLDIFKEMGKKTLGITFVGEPINHEVLKTDMHFTNLEDNSYDLGVVRHVLEHSPMPLLMLMEMYRICKKYALIVVPVPTVRMIDWQNHYSVFSKEMWEKLFKEAGWKVKRFEEAQLFFFEGKWDNEYRYLLEK